MIQESAIHRPNELFVSLRDLWDILKVAMLSKSDTASIIELMRSKWPKDTVARVKNFKSYEVDQARQLLVSDDFYAAKVENRVVPFLGDHEILDKFPSVTVDMGAIKFVCNGAKILRPGIVKFTPFQKGDVVVVKDQQHLKGLAVGIALEESGIAESMAKGYVIENVHYISDKIWELAKE